MSDNLPSKDMRILAISDELLKDLTEDRDPQIGEPLWTLQYQNRPEPIPIDPEALRAAAAKMREARYAYDIETFDWAAAGRAAAETIDRVMLDGVNEENTFDDGDIDDQGERQRIARSLSIYARQFHIPAEEGEDLSSWLARVEQRRRGMREPQYTQMMPFLALLKVFTAAAMGTDVDELDELIKRKNAPQVPTNTGGPGYGPGPLQTPQHVCNGSCGPNGHVPSTPMSPVQGCGCGCNSTGKATIPTVALSPAFKRAIGVGQVAAPKKDSLLNPPAKGFIGSDKYGYDPDVD